MKKARPYQLKAAQALFDAIKTDPTCHPVAALPTGSGKTVVLAELIDLCLTDNFKSNVLVLSHVKEILEQNYNSLCDAFEGYDIGLYSAGLESKTKHKITIAGIQSIYRNPKDFKNFNLIIIDECHLVNTKDAGMYRDFLSKIKANYVGLTATPFRTGYGYVYKGAGALFNCMPFNMCNVDGFAELIESGYLCPLISKGTATKLDTADLDIKMGDYVESEMSERFDHYEITSPIVDEIVKFGESYKKWLIFAIDIEHANHITEELLKRGIPTTCVHSKMETDRDIEVARFKAGKYRCLVNVNILTTGFDAPDIDLIAMLRPTESPILHIQTLGRGMRISPSKEHCLVLDFAGNVMRLGPINDVRIHQVAKKKDGGGGEAPVKECPECQGHLHVSAKTCMYCGYVFPSKLSPNAAEVEIIKTKISVKQPEWLDVTKTLYMVHKKDGSPDMVKVTYLCGMLTVHDYVCIEHSGYAGHKAKNWVAFRWCGDGKIPTSTNELLAAAHSNKLKVPSRILVSTGAKFPTVDDVQFVKTR